MVRYRTTGVIEKKFEIDGHRIWVFDVGGQKAERKKWINCFNDTDIVIFMVNLSSYTHMMYEDLS